jgi:PAS domain S-box-containing protein
MAIKLYISVMIFMSGMIFYAAIHHYTIGQLPQQRRVQLLFSGLSLLMALFILSNVQTLQASTVSDFIQANRLNFAIYASFAALLPWFFAEFAGVKPMAILAGLTGLTAICFIVNLIQPYTILYKEIHGLARMTLPWGEEITLPLATNSLWFYIGLTVIVLDIIFGFYTLTVRFRQNRRHSTLFMMFALGLFSAGTVTGILFRMGIAHIPPLGPLGYMGMIIVMGLTLNYEIHENRKQTEESRKKSEEKFIKFFMLAPSGMSVSSLTDGRIFDINKEFERSFGYSRDEVIGRTSIDIGIWLDVRDRDEVVRLVRTGGKVKDLELRLRAKNGNIITHRVFAETIEMDNEPYLLSTFEDITERRKAEDARKKSEEMFSKFFMLAPAGICVSTLNEGRIFDVNIEYERLTGYSRDELIGHTTIDLGVWADPRDREQLVRLIQTEGKVKDLEVPSRNKNGDMLTLRFYAERIEIDNVPYLLSAFIDITERKRTEALLQESERKYRELVEHANSIILRWGRDGKITFMNEFGLNFFGFSEKELIGHHWLDTIVPSTESTGRDLSALIEQIRINPKAFEQNINENIRRNGERVWISWTNKPVLDQQGRLVEVFSVGSDITERKLAEEALRESEIKLRAVFENSRDAIGIAKNGVHFFANPAYLKLFGYESNEKILGTSILNSIAPSHHQQLLDNIQLRTTKQPAPSLYVTRGRKSDGTEFPMEISASTFELQDEIFTIANIRDITERLQAAEEKSKLENQLLQAQKMEAIGKLAGGVAHDFNNILTIYSTYGEMLNKKLQNDEVLRSYAERIVEATGKAVDLTHSLLAFSRKQTISFKPVDINEIIRKVELLLQRIIGEDIELRTTLSDTALTVMVDPAQIEQVLMNLATNARDAMPKGGLLSVLSEVVQLTDNDVKWGEVENAGMYARISVSDTGQGMDKTRIERIFEPFFTTKEVGKGTGLGLSIVYGIIKQHSGTIRVYSEPDKGTVFKIYLPLTQSETLKSEVGDLPVPRGGSETILLVEDNEAVRASIKVVLEDGGYKVIEAVDGNDAIAEFYRHRDEIMLLLTDVIMPKKNGKEVYEVIRSIKPDIKALFISGYTADIITSKGLLDEGLHFMHKPPAPDALKRKVREILDSR